jgi:SAM-dependent methyltransferase
MDNRKYDIEYGNIRNALDYFLRWGIRGVVLDIGTNVGSLPNELHRIGYDVYGLDVHAPAIEAGRKRYPAIRDRLLVGDGKTLPFESGTFDAVTMFDVIEHVPHINTFMLEVNRVLKDGGKLIFQTPNKYINSVWSTITWRSLEWKKHHCSLQTLPGLRKLLAQSGFGSIHIDKFSVDTEFNRDQVRQYLGRVGGPLLKATAFLPLGMYPNFYGRAVKVCVPVGAAGHSFN